jgi:hypothetical protein
MTRGLFIRASEDLLTAIDDLAQEEMARHPGKHASKADVVRELLERAVARNSARRGTES